MVGGLREFWQSCDPHAGPDARLWASSYSYQLKFVSLFMARATFFILVGLPQFTTAI